MQMWSYWPQYELVEINVVDLFLRAKHTSVPHELYSRCVSHCISHDSETWPLRSKGNGTVSYRDKH